MAVRRVALWLQASRTRRYLAVALAWTFVGLMATVQRQSLDVTSPLGNFSWWEVLRGKLLLWLVWGAFIPWIVWACRRHRPTYPPRFWDLAALTGWSGVIVASFLVLQCVLGWVNMNFIMNRPVDLGTLSELVLSNNLAFFYLAFWATAAVVYAADYSRELHEQQVASLELNLQLTEARWHALQARIQPHFLLNALTTIGFMVRESRTEEAYDVLVRLAELLRESLRKGELPFVSLERELEFSQHFLEIARARFPERLQFRMDVPSDLGQLLVPTLILQPLVENAVVHGLKEPHHKLDLEIQCGSDNGKLSLQVLDNGPGFPKNMGIAVEEGFGIRSTRDRLAQLYGDRAKLFLEKRMPRGVRASIEMPMVSA